MMACQDKASVTSVDRTDKAEKAASAAKTTTNNKIPASQRVATGDPLLMTISSTTGKKGEEACVSIKTGSFNGIVGYQHSLNFNPKELKYKSTGNYGIAHLSDANFGATKVDQGLINFLWYDMNVKGITVPDETTIFDLCFEILGESGSKSEISITDNPTAMEVVGPEKTKLPLSVSSGYITSK